MPNRITVTYTCNHEGKKLPPVVEKHWGICQPPAKVCFCLPDGEKPGQFKPTLMNFKIEVSEDKPE